MRVPIAMAMTVALGLVAASPSGARVLVMAAAVPPPPCPAAAVAATLVLDGSYSPATREAGSRSSLGGKVGWTWGGGTVSESVTYRGKLALFDSGVRTSGATFSQSFHGAGTYPYYSTVNTSQKGSITVPLCHVPRADKVRHPIWVQTANRKLATTAEDVEVKRPGSTHWAWLRYGYKGMGFFWTPTSAGTYKLRSRLRRPANNTTSQFSPISTMSVS
jgi:plastocyanin